jgi:hypothetical protein
MFEGREDRRVPRVVERAVVAVIRPKIPYRKIDKKI